MEKNTLTWRKLVVRVFEKTTTKEQYRGTAFLINDRYLLTARHVIEESPEKNDSILLKKDQIVLRNGPWDDDQYLEETPIPHPDTKIDIALLRLRMPNSKDIEYWPLVEHNQLVGKDVEIAGFEDEQHSSYVAPFRVLRQESQWKLFCLQKKVEHGPSGGPVIFNNQIVGVLRSRTDAPDPRKDQNHTYIHPCSAFKDFLSDHDVVFAVPKPQTKIVPNRKAQIDFKNLHPEERVAMIDRGAQWDLHIEQRIKTEKGRKTFAFVVAGVQEEWPGSLKHRLRIHLQGVKPQKITLKERPGNYENWEHDFWASLVEPFSMLHFMEESEAPILKSKLRRELSESETPLLFYCFLHEDTSEQLIRDVVQSWESIRLDGSSHQHFLLIMYEMVVQGFCAFLTRLVRKRGDQKVNKWRQNLVKILAKDGPRIVSPALESPTRKDINYWSNTVLEDSEDQMRFNKALRKFKDKKIPHLILKETYIDIASK